MTTGELVINRPIVFFDLETTSANIQSARIVQGCFVRLEPGGWPEPMPLRHGADDAAKWQQRINPGIPIPPEASEIHGIRDKDVADCARFKDVACELMSFIGEADLSGYNLLRFDIPVLRREFERAGWDFPLAHRRIVDVQRIFFRYEPRTLEAALEFYCKEKLDGAHDAGADVQATIRVLGGQLQRYEHLPRSIDELHALSTEGREDFVDFEGTLRWDGDGDVVFSFGKHEGRKLRCTDRSYLSWMMRQDFSREVKRIVTEVLAGKPPRRPQPAGARS